MKVVLGAGALLLSMAAYAAPQSFNIPAGDLKAAVDAYKAATGQQLVYKGADLKGRVSKGVQGAMTAEQALEQLLKGTGLKLHRDESGAILIFRDEVSSSESSVDTEQAPVAQVFIQGQALSHLAELERTGTRTEADPMTLPMSVTTVNGSLIKQQQALTLRDAVANVAGVSEGGADGSFGMRGFSAGIMRNGNLSIGGTSYDPPLMSIEKVEVVKGPEAIIAGVTAGYGGIINVITKTPQVKPITEVSSTVGSHGYYDVELDVGRALSVDKRWLVRLVATTQGAGKTIVGYEGASKKYFSPSLTWRSKQSGTEITLQHEHQEGRKPPAVETFTFGSGLTRDLPLVRFGDADYGSDKMSKVSTVSANQRIGEDWKLAAQYTVDEQTSAATQSLNGLGSNFGLPQPAILGFNAHTESLVKVKTAKIELRGAIETGPVEHKLLFAVDKVASDVRSAAQYLSVRSTDLTTGIPTDLSPTFAPIFGGLPTPKFTGGVLPKELGVLVMDQMFWKDWVALLGFRQIWFKPDEKNLALLGEFKKALPSMGLVYRLNDDHSFYGNASKGFVPNLGLTAAGGTPLGPENAKQYEVGYKALLMNRKIAATFSVYDIRQRNVAVPDFAHPENICNGGPCYLMVEGVRSTGVEMEVSGDVSKHLGLRASISHNNKQADSADQAGIFYARNEANLWAIVKFGEWLGGQWWMGTGVQARSARNPLPDGVNNPGQARVDLSSGYDAKNWSVIAGVKNALDKRLYTVGSGLRGAAALSQPRELYLTLRYKFD